MFIELTLPNEVQLQDVSGFVAILTVVSLPTPSDSQGGSTVLPLPIPGRVINATQKSSCPPSEVIEMAWQDTAQDIENSIRITIIPTLCDGQTQDRPAASCSILPTICPSDYYWIVSSNGTAVQVYCDTDRVCSCSSSGGWTLTANLNMSDP